MENGHSCWADVLQPLHAVQGALGKINAVASGCTRTYVTTAVLKGGVAHTVGEPIEVLELWTPSCGPWPVGAENVALLPHPTWGGNMRDR